MLLGKSAGLFRAGGTVAGSARFHEVDAVVEFALLAGIEGFHGAVVAMTRVYTVQRVRSWAYLLSISCLVIVVSMIGLK